MARPPSRFGGRDGRPDQPLKLEALEMNNRSLVTQTRPSSALQTASMTMNAIAAGSTLAFNIMAGGLIGYIIGARFGEHACLVCMAVGMFMGFFSGVDGLHRNSARY